jgi:hypothetical protein
VFLELFSNNVMEPLLYGRSVGISEVAVILAAVIWAWLWGPVGLVLATPMTVCLVVLGKYVSGLRVLDQLLGEPPPVSEPVRLYQRLLARDSLEAEQLVQKYRQQHSIVQTADNLLLPTLELTSQDAQLGVIDEADETWILQEVEDLIDEQLSTPDSGLVVDSESDPNDAPAGLGPLIVAMPARSTTEELALRMLERVVAPVSCRFEILPFGTLLSERAAYVSQNRPIAVCLSVSRTSDLTLVRRLCKKLRRENPDTRLIVGHWSDRSDSDVERQLSAAGADQVVISIDDMQRRLQSLIHLQLAKRSEPASETPLHSGLTAAASAYR